MNELNKFAGFVFLTFAVLHSSVVSVDAQYLSHQDIAALPPIPADARISYGPDSLQFGELRIPEGSDPHPVAIVIHGGCWLSIANLHVMDHFCDELTKVGIATWNLEYRRVDSPGGGWPGTFNDIGQGVDYIRILAEKYNLDLSRVVCIGHSSGGHLALWAGARHRVSESSQLFSENPLKPTGVVSLAGPADLRGMVERTKAVCGGDVIHTLLGGSFEEVPDRYRNASPATLLPNGVKQIVIHGADDPAVPPELGQEYVEAGNLLGESIGFFVIPEASHFELIAPWTSSWPIVEASVRSLMFVPQDKNSEMPE
jgi:acetyl esterase/lipase